MRKGVDRYITTGLVTGGFLTAFLENDLKETYARADHINAMVIEDYLSFFTMYAPSPCWGSRERVAEWRRVGGLRGFLTRQQKPTEELLPEQFTGDTNGT